MEQLCKKQIRLGQVLVTFLCLIVFVIIFVEAVLAAEVTGHGVAGLTVNYTDTSKNTGSYPAKAWTSSSGTLSWSDTTGSSGWLSKKYYYKGTTLTLTNNSKSTLVLSFSYNVTLNGGVVTIDGDSIDDGSGSFTKTLADGESIEITTKSSETKANKTTVNLSNIKLEVQQVEVKFAKPTGGSYTKDGAAITNDTTVTAPSTTVYKLVATPNENYVFNGWYLNDTLMYTETTVNAASFSTSGTIVAKFELDPLFVQATVPENSAYSKEQLISINTRYFHDNTDKVVFDGNFPGNNSAYSKLAQSAIKDKIDVQYVPSLQWNNSMGVSYSGTAKGDYVTGLNEESYSYARMMSDVIRIRAKENCNISFNYTNGINGGWTLATASQEKTNRIYVYKSQASTATIAQIKSGTQLSDTSGSSGTIALSKNDYVYILAEGYERDRYLATAGTMDFSYNASISGFSVSYNEKKDVLSSGFIDNTGNSLGSGKIVVNNVSYDIGTNGKMTDMTFADLATVELKVGSAPANYVHIGWAITPKSGTTTYKYSSVYNCTLTEDITINALFVPRMTIQMGKDGYKDATYTLFDGTSANGQYIARDANCTAYYTSLADAFAKTDTVVLLASATINGDWTIPAGKTFVIPYGINDNGSTVPTYTGTGYSGDYCTVTLNGDLTVEGTLIINGQQNQSTGAPGGYTGRLNIASGKKIQVSGSLYAYGPVIGEGTVEAYSTAEIHETLEFSDNTVVIYIYNIYNEKRSKEVFPFNTMFVNSIEVPVTYQSGASLSGHVALRYDTVCAAEIPLIGSSDAMMNLSKGTIIKYYDKSKGQFVFLFNEGSEVSTDSFSISMDVTIIGRTENITLNTADYYLPLSAPFRFEVAGNLTVNDKYKLLPGMTIDIKEGGTLTIAKDAELIFYRRNDYDYRGKHGNSTEQWGYSERPYPSNPQRFNGVSYPYSFNNTNMGSAKLNVDGTLIVNGGLYVTDELQTDTANGISILDNGYNYLTGSGTIDMTNVTTNITSINEVMRASGTNDLKWDTVAVVPIKGLKEDATANAPEQYESLKGIMYGSTNAAGLNVWSADPCAGGHDLTGHEAKESTCTEQGNSAYWECKNCEKYFGNAEGSVEIEKDSWVANLAGHSYTEEITTQPTLSTTGVKTYTCRACGDSYTEEIPCVVAVAQIGENKFASLAEALEVANNDDVIMLLAMPEKGVVIAKNVTINLGTIDYKITCGDGWGVIDNEDGSYTVAEGIFKIYASNVKVGDCLDMFFYIDAADLDEGKSYYAKIMKEGSSEASIVSDQDWATYMIGKAPYKRFSFNGIAAKEMTDEISVTIYTVGEDGVMGTDDDEVASTKCTDSIENYAIRTLNNTPEDRGTLRAILVDLLNYGAACQVQFNYVTKDLATARLLDEQKSCATTPDQWEEYNVAIDTSDNYIGASVVTESNLIYRLYFRDLTLTENTKVTITYVNFYGKKKELKLDRSDIIRSEENSTAEVSVYYVDVTEMAVSDGRCLIQCSITDVDAAGQPNEIAYCKNDSIEGAVRRFQGQEAAKNAYDMLLNFVYSAEAYFR